MRSKTVRCTFLVGGSKGQARVWIVGLSRFVIIFVLRFSLQDEPELQPDEEGLVARALGGPVLGAGGAQEEQGWERLGL